MRMSAKAEYAVRAMVQLATAASGTVVKTTIWLRPKAYHRSFSSIS